MKKILFHTENSPMSDKRVGYKKEAGQGESDGVKKDIVPESNLETANTAAIIGYCLAFTFEMHTNFHCWATPGKVPQYLFHSAAAFSGDSSRGVVALQAGHFTANRLSPTHLNCLFSCLFLITRWAVPSSKSSGCSQAPHLQGEMSKISTR